MQDDEGWKELPKLLAADEVYSIADSVLRNGNDLKMALSLFGSACDALGVGGKVLKDLQSELNGQIEHLSSEATNKQDERATDIFQAFRKHGPETARKRVRGSMGKRR